MGGLFGGGDSAPPPPPAPPAMPDLTGLFGGLFEAFGGLAEAMMSNMPQVPQNIPSPEVVRNEPIDFRERARELENRARADFTSDKNKKKGAVQSNITSPLLDDDEADVTSSLLSDGS